MKVTKKQIVLVTGATGLVGSNFVDKNESFELLVPSSEEFDLTDPKIVRSYLQKNNPNWIVNFAAYTDVTKAELQSGDKEGEAWKINVVGVKNMLKAFKSKKFIQISTDMVFPGNLNNPGPYTEDSVPPKESKDLTWYGWTKNRAEELVRQNGGVILRIIYPISFEFDKKPDYIRNPIKKFAQGKMYPLFNDQQVSITYIEEVTEALKKIIKRNMRGVFHVSSDTTTPFELIKHSLEGIGEDAGSVKSASVVEFLKTQTNTSRYPIFGGLTADITAKKLGMHFSTWKEVLTKIPQKSSGPREYKKIEIANSVVVEPVKYLSEPDGFVAETSDFVELGYFLGYKFEPRSMYAIGSPENVGRGGHLETRSKLVTVLSGAIYFCMVDMRAGADLGKASEFYLGDHAQSIGKSVLVPEGVVDYWVPVGGSALTHNVADKPYNKFGNRIALNMKDPQIGLHIPEGTLFSVQIDEHSAVLSLKEFIENIK